MGPQPRTQPVAKKVATGDMLPLEEWEIKQTSTSDEALEPNHILPCANDDDGSFNGR